jgi:membrane-bound lytic murein transglycosylase D
MNEESDPERLASLEERLFTLTGNAKSTLAALDKSDKKKAAALAESGDPLDRQIREILGRFDASTYAVPPIFKERLKFHIDELVKAPNLKFVYRRKQRYWPMITREFSALGLPEEMAYVAWAETQFDPKAKSPVGAAGMWQMTATTAQSYGLRVDGKTDERYDPERETKAAARHLANLLAEYGTDSFMLAMASYNRGEAGVRRVLHEIAREPGGFRKEKRDFWHLYRMKKLPEETREYVPKVLAAAIVSHEARNLGLDEPD